MQYHAVSKIEAIRIYFSILHSIVKFKMQYSALFGLQHPGASWGRPISHVVSLHALRESNNALVARPSGKNAPSLKKTLCSASYNAASTETGAERAEWPPLEGRFSYRQLRALQVRGLNACVFGCNIRDISEFRNFRDARFESAFIIFSG